MICDPLAYTGPGVPVDLLTMVAIGCLVAGALLLLLTHRRGRAITVALMVLVGGTAVMLTAGTPRAAVADECPPAPHRTAHNSLTITQTSVLAGLAPGVVPVAITGIVSNDGTDTTDIVAIDVQIFRVSTVPGVSTGRCDASDYVVLNRRMAVGRTLGPGGSTTFDGAFLGFRNKGSNQDACKRATVVLLYTANPG